MLCSPAETHQYSSDSTELYPMCSTMWQRHEDGKSHMSTDVGQKHDGIRQRDVASMISDPRQPWGLFHGGVFSPELSHDVSEAIAGEPHPGFPRQYEPIDPCLPHGPEPIQTASGSAPPVFPSARPCYAMGLRIGLQASSYAWNQLVGEPPQRHLASCSLLCSSSTDPGRPITCSAG